MAEPKPRKKLCSKGADCCGWTPCQREEVRKGKRPPSPTAGTACVEAYEEKLRKTAAKKTAAGMAGVRAGPPAEGPEAAMDILAREQKGAKADYRAAQKAEKALAKAARIARKNALAAQKEAGKAAHKAEVAVEKAARAARRAEEMAAKAARFDGLVERDRKADKKAGKKAEKTAEKAAKA